MRYHCATSALPALLRALMTLSQRCEMSQSGYLGACHASNHRRNRPPRYGKIIEHGRLAQLVARFLHTEEVIGSSPVSPTTHVTFTFRVELLLAR